METINQVSDNIIEIVKQETKTETSVVQYNKDVLGAEKIKLQERIAEIDKLLLNFEVVK